MEPEKKRILKQRAERLKSAKSEAISADEISGLAFQLGEERYILESVYVSEVIHLDELTTIPGLPPFFLGFANIRGKILAVISLRRFLNLPEPGITNHNRVMVIQHSGIELGILADDIIGDRPFSFEKLQSNVPGLMGTRMDFLHGVTEDQFMVLNVKKFITNESLWIDQ